MYIDLANKFIKRNKKLSGYICVALIIAGSLFISGEAFINAYSRLNIANQEQLNGGWHFKVKSDYMRVSDTFIADHADMLERIGREEYLYSSAWSDGDNEFTMDIVAGDRDMFDISGLNVYKGRLPENEHEIVLDYALCVDGKPAYSLYNIGDTITFSVGKRVAERHIVYGDTDEGRIEDMENVIYTITGFMDSGKGFYNSITSYTLEKTIKSPSRYWFRMTEGDTVEKIDRFISDCGLERNNVFDSENYDGGGLEDDYSAAINGPLYYIIRSNGFMGSNEVVKHGFQILVFLIFLAGFLMVTNIYQLVLNTRKTDYATLFALGMEDKEILYISLFEGMALWLLSLLISIGVSIVLNAGMMALAKNVIFHNIRNLQMRFSFSGILIGGGSTLIMMLSAVLCNFLSKQHQSMKQRMNTKHGYAKQRRLSGIIPIEIRLSLRYIAENKLKFILTVLSFTTSIILLYSLYCAEEELEVSELVNGEYYADDFFAWGTDVRNIPELMEEMPYVQKLSEVYSAAIYVPDNILPYTQSIRSDEAFSEDFEDENTYIGVSFLSEEYYEKSIRPRLYEDMTYEDWIQSGEGILADWYRGSDNKMHEAFENDSVLTIDYDKSDEMLTPYEAGSISCKYRVRVSEKEEVNYHTGFLDIFIYFPLDKMPELFDGSTYQFLHITAEEGHEYELLEWLNENKDVYNYTLQDNITEKIGKKNIRFIVLLCLSFVSALLLIVCIVNVWNTIESNLYGRSYELSVMEELGMSNFQKFYTCMPDMLAALLSAGLIANAVARLILSRYLTKVVGIPLWLSLGVIIIYFLFVLVINVPLIRRMNMVRVRENG